MLPLPLDTSRSNLQSPSCQIGCTMTGLRYPGRIAVGKLTPTLADEHRESQRHTLIAIYLLSA